VLEPGTVLDHKLRIERVLGRGGMGEVAIATHLELDQRVAVKVLHDHVARDPGAVERFLREARAAAKLRSEHVCRVSDVGRLTNGIPYLVMELLEGSDLAAIVARGRLPVAQAVDHVLQACVAIAEAHAARIVHRDLKPANLFVARRLDGTPLVKVLDFGIAKAGTEPALTATDAVMGSPGYMSPEQFHSARDVDARTDIWAVGVILYQLLAGRLPFRGTTLAELALQVTSEPPAPIELPPGLRAAVLRCLEKRREARFDDVASLAAALAPFGGPTAAATAELIAKVARPPSLDTTLPSSDAPVATTLDGAAAAVAPVSRTRWRWIAGGAGLAIAAAIAVGVAIRRGGAANTDPRAAMRERFERALAADRCGEAAQATYDMLHAGAPQAEVDPLNERRKVCEERFSAAAGDPGGPGAAHMLLASADESFDAGRLAEVTSTVELVLEHEQSQEDQDHARALEIEVACKQRDSKAVQRYASQLAAGPARTAAAAYCKSVGAALE
jgi:serine/threonine-protein kinase